MAVKKCIRAFNQTRLANDDVRHFVRQNWKRFDMDENKFWNLLDERNTIRFRSGSYKTQTMQTKVKYMGMPTYTAVLNTITKLFKWPHNL